MDFRTWPNLSNIENILEKKSADRRLCFIWSSARNNFYFFLNTNTGPMSWSAIDFSINFKFLIFHHIFRCCNSAEASHDVMAASENPPQMANFQTFYRAVFYFFLAAESAHFAHCYFVLNFSLSAQCTFQEDL